MIIVRNIVKKENQSQEWIFTSSRQVEDVSRLIVARFSYLRPRWWLLGK